MLTSRVSLNFCEVRARGMGQLDNRESAETRDRTGDLQIFSLTLSQLSYRGGWCFARQHHMVAISCKPEHSVSAISNIDAVTSLYIRCHGICKLANFNTCSMRSDAFLVVRLVSRSGFGRADAMLEVSIHWKQNEQDEAFQNSATGTRTRVARVRAEYPNQLDYSGL